ncbi:hypothetical protein HMPREF9554_01913 [Treponema phagedenis F0421]|nr:hypothetical protein HMPREF9554_01913 [Treponema phagedenis F0421]
MGKFIMRQTDKSKSIESELAVKQIKPDELCLRLANEKDLPRILEIETESFSSEIVESPETFAERIRHAGNCFYLLCKTPAKGERAEEEKILAYLSAELWEELPPMKDEFFALGHSAKERHRGEGKVLYIASFALAKNNRGKKVLRHGKTESLASFFFRSAIDTICSDYPKIDTQLLLVHNEWTAAKYIYQQQGFYEIATFTRFEGFGKAPALIYKKDIPQTSAQN